MNKLIFCCFGLLSACALTPTQQDVDLKRVVAEAKAKDCDSALSQAKINAADNAAGTFVHGQRTLLEDRFYSENLNEYTSGVVRRYNVMEKSGGSPCRIRIEAWVEPGRAKVDLPGSPDRVGVNDINHRAKQIRNNQAFLAQGWLYLAVVIDLYSRTVVGWSMKPTMKTDIVLDALLMAVWRRKPKHPVIIHSDQGSQFSSDDFARWCQDNRLIPSMSRRGNCYDNAVAESFFSSLKKEIIKKKIYATRQDAQSEIFEYIEVFYNRKRRHSHLNQLSPMAFELLQFGS